DPGRAVSRRRGDRAECRRRQHRGRGRQFRRPADPGRQPLPFRRDQPGACLRQGTGARAAARHPGGDGGAVRARTEPDGAADPLRRQAEGARVPRRDGGPGL
ncbi:MAG: Urease beta subunit, partial [uncultured Craurococcus sp.]